MKKVILGLVVVLAVLFLVGCGSTPDTVNTVPEQPVQQIPEPVAEQSDAGTVAEDVAPEPVSGSDLGVTEKLTDLSCSNKVVSLTLTNVGNEEVAVADVVFRVNAKIDTTPNCDADTLAAGQSTHCTGVEAVGISTVTQVVMVTMPDRTQSIKSVRCENTVTDNTMADDAVVDDTVDTTGDETTTE